MTSLYISVDSPMTRGYLLFSCSWKVPYYIILLSKRDKKLVKNYQVGFRETFLFSKNNLPAVVVTFCFSMSFYSLYLLYDLNKIKCFIRQTTSFPIKNAWRTSDVVSDHVIT